MDKTISREEFRDGVEVCKRIFHQARGEGLRMPAAVADIMEQVIAGWAEGLESYLFDGIPPSADPEEPKA